MSSNTQSDLLAPGPISHNASPEVFAHCDPLKAVSELTQRTEYAKIIYQYSYAVLDLKNANAMLGKLTAHFEKLAMYLHDSQDLTDEPLLTADDAFNVRVWLLTDCNLRNPALESLVESWRREWDDLSVREQKAKVREWEMQPRNEEDLGNRPNSRFRDIEVVPARGE